MANMQYKHWELVTDGNNIVWCHLDLQGASTNVLSAAVLGEFEMVLAGLEASIPAGVVILSGKSNGFIAGADVTEFESIRDSAQALAIINHTHALFNRLEALKCPTLALINGFCLGGGLELALACRYRIALDDPRTRLGLPEVKLGIHPGFGGTARLIALTGALQALPLMLAGNTVDARRAKSMGLVDHAVPLRQLTKSAVTVILQRPPQHKPGKFKQLANTGIFRPLVAWFLRRELEKRVRLQHYPAPFALLELWRQHGANKQQMPAAEARSVADLITTDTSRNLVRVYLLQEKLKAAGKQQDFQVRHVHVIGAGVMGGDIAAWCALQGFTVSLQDREPVYIAPAIKRAHKLFKRRFKAGHRYMAAMDRLIPDHKGYGIERADVVIEAIVEDRAAKAGLFKSLEPRVKADAILATNTSSIPLDEISNTLQQPERLVGMHFFNPVAQMQLVEIIHSTVTAPEWVARVAAFCRQLDRLPLPVKSSPGFLVNRILTPYLLETVTMIEEGIQGAVIDKLMKSFGMPMGPVELADTVGLDICLSVAENMAGLIDVTIPGKLRQMVAAGSLGRKSGRGFYSYRNGRISGPKAEPDNADRQGLEDRLVLRILNECAACLREELVADADALDAGMVYGTGFAPFRGGPLHYARQRGCPEIVAQLAVLQQSHGDRFRADEAWQDLLQN
jgi:3-hydroxyacyl-CoA dehydrogenase/enoyl-CoA hydratase/3-hydroxybutyryl-CoA epimerase